LGFGVDELGDLGLAPLGWHGLQSGLGYIFLLDLAQVVQGLPEQVSF